MRTSKAEKVLWADYTKACDLLWIRHKRVASVQPSDSYTREKAVLKAQLDAALEAVKNGPLIRTIIQGN